MVKARKLVLQTQVMGMNADIATIRIGSYARQPELSAYTALVCPGCKEKPTYHGSYYECDCGAKYTTWQKLLRVFNLVGGKSPSFRLGMKAETYYKLLGYSGFCVT